MADYGKTLKQLIDFSNVKMYLVAEAVGYDVSYISKWCNKGYLPSAKAAPKINGILAGLLSDDISHHGDLEEFQRQFGISVTEDTMEEAIRDMLQRAYEDSGKKEASARGGKPTVAPVVSTARTLVHTNEIRRFFRQDFTECLRSVAIQAQKPVEVLCTLDLCLFLAKILPEISFPEEMDFHVRIAVNEDRLYRDKCALLARLYTFLSINCRVTFDIYDDEKLSGANVLLVENRLAAICSLDADGRMMSVFCVSDQETVHHIRSKLVPLFNRSRVLLCDSNPADFHRKGYRTDFYSRNHFQILLACGFEFLLPRDCWQSVVDTARSQYKNEHIALLVRRLQVTWEEIFEHGSVDFFILKTALLRYIETGEIIFTDVVHRLDPQHRKSHLQNVLDVTGKNPNIVFYLIDDEKFPVKNELAYFSIFNNREKAFLKNPNRYHCDNGSYFYSIRDNGLIARITDYLDDIKKTPLCTRYGHEELVAFYQKYASLVNRMIDL